MFRNNPLAYVRDADQPRTDLSPSPSASVLEFHGSELALALSNQAGDFACGFDGTFEDIHTCSIRLMQYAHKRLGELIEAAESGTAE